MENNDLQQENLVREISYALSRASGWMKFLGIVMIIYGAIIAITVVGIIIAWLPMWMGILLYKAANNARTATEYGNKDHLINALKHVNNYFTISGILFIIALILGTIIIAVAWTTGFAIENMHNLI